MKQWKLFFICCGIILSAAMVSACAKGPTPEEVTKEYLQAVRELDFRKQNTFLQSPLTENELQQMERDWEERFDIKNIIDKDDTVLNQYEEKIRNYFKMTPCEIKNIKVEGDRATVTVDITGKSYSRTRAAAEEALDQIVAEDEQRRTENLSEKDQIIRSRTLDLTALELSEEVKRTIKVKLLRIDREWKIENQSASDVELAFIGTSREEIHP